MNLFDPISSIMTIGVITLAPTDTLIKAEEIFANNRIHHIPIVENEKLVGMISSSDLLLFKRGFTSSAEDIQHNKERLQAYEINHIMTKRLATLDVSDRINVALEIFNENLFHALPITENDSLVGIVTTFDIIKQLSLDQEVVAKY
jgi:acetoin utilization protein AcuB